MNAKRVNNHSISRGDNTKMKIFQLDLSGLQLPDWWTFSPVVYCTPHRYWEHDFYVLDAALTAERGKFHQFFSPDVNPVPVGFNAANLPVGAVLRRLPDQPAVNCPLCGHDESILIDDHVFCPDCGLVSIGPDE